MVSRLASHFLAKLRAFYFQNCYRSLSKKVFQTEAVGRMILHHETACLQQERFSGGVLRKTAQANLASIKKAAVD